MRGGVAPLPQPIPEVDGQFLTHMWVDGTLARVDGLTAVKELLTLKLV